MFPRDELTPYCPGERKALEAGDEPDKCEHCRRVLFEFEFVVCDDCLSDEDDDWDWDEE